MRKTIAALAVLSALTLAGCTSANNADEPAAETNSAGTTSATTPTSSAAASSAAPKATTPGVGETVRADGVSLVVNSVTASRTISYLEGNIRGVYGTKDARQGGQFIIVNTTIENVGSKSMDLTCGYPIDNKLFDEGNRQFDTIDSLYKVEGNPECNDNLQPGFTSTMKWVYEVPLTASPSLFGFRDIESTSDANVKFVDTGIVQPAQ